MGKKSSAATAITGNEELHAAARSGDLKAVQAICSANPLAVNSRDRHSRMPCNSIEYFGFHIKVFHSRCCILVFVSLRTLNYRLHLAAWSGHAEVVNYLCKNKADVGAAAMDDMGAIHFAAQKGHLDVIKILVGGGVSVKSTNRKLMTALHYAAQGSNVELVTYLLKKGANKDLKNRAGMTAVDLASSEEIRKLLLEYESSSRKVVSNGSEEGEKAEAKTSSVEEVEEAALQGEKAGEEGKDESMKRKNEESSEENQQGAKKTKVALGHLLADDDMPEEEEEEDQ